jgi:hypothetical protein
MALIGQPVINKIRKTMIEHPDLWSPGSNATWTATIAVAIGIAMGVAVLFGHAWDDFGKISQLALANLAAMGFSGPPPASAAVAAPDPTKSYEPIDN